MNPLPDLFHILPELFIAGMAMALLIYGAYAGESSVGFVKVSERRPMKT